MLLIIHQSTCRRDAHFIIGNNDRILIDKVGTIGECRRRSENQTCSGKRSD
ncbi:hypothetical protein HF925_10505 [Acidithiobacillus ferriphilus]|uniref:hypothetical protein n=1 Tax=Acidithiobacillus ferriphilus TaxID=1689834 RepID=UPI001C076945|nr:hypothetical protein [Acidithiobacillus ferriphilus]MBU2848998.1 hypothetical protein [Acidithiobacillus ferriphilus]